MTKKGQVQEGRFRITMKRLAFCMFVCSMIFCSCTKEEKRTERKKEPEKEVIEEIAESKVKNTIDNAIENTLEDTEQPIVMESEMEKGYDLPISDQDRNEAERESDGIMGLLTDIYKHAEKGNSSNVVLHSKVMEKMTRIIKKQGYPVIRSERYSNMENYQKVERFLSDAALGKKSAIVIYRVHTDGGIGREKYVYDGKEMYLLASNMIWDDADKPCMSFISYTRIKEWRYSKQGWFCYELCVPEYPEVTEMVDGCCLIRIKPRSRKKRRLSKQCVQGLGYQGNNLLCSNWDENHMEKLDYNGLYEYFYEMKYKKKYNSKKYPNGIPKDSFESLMMEYLPVTPEMIQKYAVFDKKKGTYLWQRLGCFNYAPDYFGTSIPEVTRIQENSDGTMTLTVDAVCEMVLCDEAVITHELTVRFAEDGSFRYLGNKILDEGMKEIPPYQHRLEDQ